MEGKNVLKLALFLLDEVFSPYLFNFFCLIDDRGALCHYSVYDASEVDLELESPDSSIGLSRVEFVSFDKKPLLEVLDALNGLGPETVEPLAAFDDLGLDQLEMLELLVDDGLTLSLHFVDLFLHPSQLIGRIYQSVKVWATYRLIARRHPAYSILFNN